MSEQPPTTHAVWAALGKAMQKIGAIEKGRKNQQQGYQFRGIDEIYNGVHDVLAEVGIIMAVRVLERSVTETTTKSGSSMLHITAKIECDFISTVDGSKHTYGPVWAEGLDNSDKGSNKCLSAAQKYAVLQTFLIPTKDIVDGDDETPERGTPVQRPPQEHRPQQSRQGSAWEKFKETNAAPNGDAEQPGPPTQLAKPGDLITAIPADIVARSRTLTGKPFDKQTDVELAATVAELDRLANGAKDQHNRVVLATVAAVARHAIANRGEA